MLAALFNPDTWAAVPFHFWSAAFFVLGCLWGSFLNVCIYRMPRGMSIIAPPSHCPHCGYSIPWYLNVPLVTWLSLRGKCANCRAPISIRYFLVELLTGALFFACWLQYGSRDNPLPTMLLAAIYCVFVAGLIVATFIDIEHFIIPDEITIGGMVVGFLASLALPALQFTTSRPDALLQSGLGIAVGGGLVFAVLNGGKLLFGKKKLELPAGSRVVFHETEMELPGTPVPLSGVEGFDPESGVLTLAFARAFVGEEVLTNGTLRAGNGRVEVQSAETSFSGEGEVFVRVLEPAPAPATPTETTRSLKERLFGKPPLPVLTGERYFISPLSLRPATERVPFEEMFFRKSDTLRLHARRAAVCERAGEPYPELFEDVAIALTPEKLVIGERTFTPTDVPFMEVETDSLVVPREAMGFGDVKFMAGIGAFLGWKAVIFSLMVSAMIGSVIGGGLVLLGRKEWSSKIPYGPYIAVATLIWMFGGREWLQWWLAGAGAR